MRAVGDSLGFTRPPSAVGHLNCNLVYIGSSCCSQSTPRLWFLEVGMYCLEEAARIALRIRASEVRGAKSRVSFLLAFPS